jgi:hypothetical protein
MATIRVAASWKFELSLFGMARMKPKMYQQIQPREVAPPMGAALHVRVAKDKDKGEVQQEIQKFLRAVNSYPARVAKEPRLTFQQHLSSIFAAGSDDVKADDRRDRSPRRH